MPFYKGQGRCYLVARDGSGNPGVMSYLGKTDNGVKIGLGTTSETRKESESGQALVDLRYEVEKNVSVEFALREIDMDVWAKVMRGLKSSIAAGTVTAEVLPTLAVGDYVRTVKPKISSVVVKDSTGTPKTLTAGVNYAVQNADAGTLKILDLTTGGPFVAPYKVDYANALATNLNLLTQSAVEYWFRFDGLNTLNGNSLALVELYRVQFDPPAEFEVKGEAPSLLTISGSALYDETKVADTLLGQFGRIVT